MSSTSGTPEQPTVHGPLFAPSGSDDLSSHRHRLLIGSMGFVLPLSLWLLAAWRPTPGLPRWGILDSVSAYYHTGAVAAFVGVLTSLAMFLFTYQGYGNEHNHRDRIAAVTSGIAALGVALFPADTVAGLPRPPWFESWMSDVHYLSAAVLFGAFFVFSFFLFPMSKPHRVKPLPTDKRVRNVVYRACGVIILACMLWVLVLESDPQRSIFWPESVALGAFSLSWLMKGRADWTLSSAGRKAWHYGPGKLVGETEE
jgi:succinate dehydrogenase/fumarate reductase cytochrome b subunit